MDEKKHLDRLFQEKLKDFEVFPDAKVWKNIEKELLKKKKRRVIPLWLRYGSTAAILLFLISTGVWFFDTQKPIPNLPSANPIVIDTITVNKESTTNKEEQTLQNENIVVSDKKAVPNSNSTNKVNTTPIYQLKNIDTESKEIIATAKSEENNDGLTNINAKEKGVKNIESEKLAIEQSQEKITSNIKQKTNVEVDKKSLMDEIDQSEIVVKDEKSNEKRWSVGSTVAPVYFNTLGKGSPIDINLSNNKMSSEPSLSYGVKVNYKINNKLSLQSGVNSVDLAYKTANVITSISSSSALSNSSNLEANVDGFNIVAFSSNATVAQNDELLAPQRGFFNLNGDLNQSLSYIEIPMEAKYAILQKKVGINLVGGVSTFILYDNSVSLFNKNGSTTLGEANNINDVNFSGNLGLDFDYNISKKLYINISPMFKYQFNTFSKNAGGFQPYYLGVYTGLNFRF